MTPALGLIFMVSTQIGTLLQFYEMWIGFIWVWSTGNNSNPPLLPSLWRSPYGVFHIGTSQDLYIYPATLTTSPEIPPFRWERPMLRCCNSLSEDSISALKPCLWAHKFSQIPWVIQLSLISWLPSIAHLPRCIFAIHSSPADRHVA